MQGVKGTGSAKERDRRYYVNHQEEVLARHRNNPNRKENDRKSSKRRNVFFRRKALFMLGDKCRRCGFSDPRALQIDHVNGDGHTERLNGIRSARKLVEHIRRNRLAYQLLCANCNWIKRFEKREYRNEGKRTET